MKPISLTLKGFRGIRDGLGRDALHLDFEQLAGDAQLIAFVGRNGRGKTTVMDNMTPYPLMPSRAGTESLGGFAYYEHVYLPESIKDLVWEHAGKRYRSQVVIRLNSKRRTEAYLHVRDACGWLPVTLPDGTVSDGKLDTYLRCVEALLGSAQTFFTSVFSSQGRRQLSTYRNAEIKMLLADLLGLDDIRALGAKAAETAKLLRAGLTPLRQERMMLQAEQEQIASEIAQFGNTMQRLATAQAQKTLRQNTLDAMKGALAQLLANKEAAMQTEARRSQLEDERRSMSASGRDTLASLDSQDQREAERLAALDRRIALRVAALAQKRTDLVAQRNKLDAVIRQGGNIERAAARLPLVEEVAAARETRVQALRRDRDQRNTLLADELLVRERIASIEREAGQAALKAQELARRFGLTAEVPCAGTDLQGQCKLLGDAHAARSLMPRAELQVARLEGERRALVAHLVDNQRQAAHLSGVQDGLTMAERKLRRTASLVSALAILAARRGELQQARDAIDAVELQIRELAAAAHGETDEEKAERTAVSEARRDIAAQRAAQSQRQRDVLNRVEAALSAMPPVFDASQLPRAQEAVARAQQAVAEAESAFLTAMRDRRQEEAAVGRQALIAQKVAHMEARCAGIEAALGTWTLFAKCLSNDGLIALSIDDAGPTLSGLANDLLLACYGPRFTVSIKTLVEIGTGETREGFDIIVHDADSGVAKSVTLMSGGERVWINECLTRAIALYLAQNAGRRYNTLFSDEADGPLDAERKRMFIAMKREVLRIGRYGREYFVSQTPELTAMADAVIDLEKLAAGGEMPVPHCAN
ncbi:DNA repair protein [Noviherbaspirillum sp. ST9]|uniref:DNA repair protein n=1 Tax=Noviherbaspirillum sp. ST9 TaxID=3401606 RepID=UPI003B587526